MGWSCNADAAYELDRWTKACLDSTGIQNVYVAPSGVRYMIEVSRKEHADGAITGSVLRYLVGGKYDGCVVPAGAFRINGDGKVKKYPTGFKGLMGK